MSWLHADASWRDVWGYRFRWTAQHLPASELQPLTQSYDSLADACLERLDELGPAAAGASRDPYALLLSHRGSDPVVAAFWASVATAPGWVDWAQLGRGQDVFHRYAGPAVVALIFQSLLGGMASGRVVETLARTGGFSPRNAHKRIVETAQHVLQVMKGVESLKPPGGVGEDGGGGKSTQTGGDVDEGGEGFASTVRVRLLHASVRRRILRLASSSQTDGGDGGPPSSSSSGRPGRRYYDVSALGVPINDLDTIGTILVFSAAPVFVGWPRQGMFLRGSEVADYLALWRYVGHLLGAPDWALESPRRARVVLESLMLAEMCPPPPPPPPPPPAAPSSEGGAVPVEEGDGGGELQSGGETSEPSARRRRAPAVTGPTANSVMLANNILTAMAGQPPSYSSRAFLAAEAWWLNGARLSRALGIDWPGWRALALVAGQCAFFAAWCYSSRLSRRWDRRRIERTRRLLWKVVVVDKKLGGLGKETLFEFQYVPDLSFTRSAPASTSPAPGSSGEQPPNNSKATLPTSPPPPPPPRRRTTSFGLGPAERRNLSALLIGCALLAAAAWGGAAVVTALLGMTGHGGTLGRWGGGGVVEGWVVGREECF